MVTVKAVAALCSIIWVTGLAFAPHAIAQTIPDATGYAQADLPGIEKIDLLGQHVSNGSFDLTIIENNYGRLFGTGAAVAEFDSSTTPFVISGYSTQKGFELGGQAKSLLDYYVDVESRLNTTVAVDVSASGGAGVVDGSSSLAGDNFSAKAEFIFDKNGAEAASGEASASQSVRSSGFTVNKMLELKTNQPYAVEISTIATGALFGDTSLSAFVDPAFKIAPTVQDPADFTIAFSPNLAAVPEASPLFLVGFGLALAAFARVARKRGVEPLVKSTPQTVSLPHPVARHRYAREGKRTERFEQRARRCRLESPQACAQEDDVSIRQGDSLGGSLLPGTASHH